MTAPMISYPLHRHAHIVYMRPEDAYLTREARQMGATVEHFENIIPALHAYVAAWRPDGD